MKNTIIWGVIAGLIAFAHGPLRTLIPFEPSTPVFSSFLCLIVVYIAIAYSIKEGDSVVWVYQNWKRHINHPSIIATQFIIVLHAFLLYQVEWLNIAVSIGYSLYFSYAMYKEVRHEIYN